MTSPRLATIICRDDSSIEYLGLSYIISGSGSGSTSIPDGTGIYIRDDDCRGITATIAAAGDTDFTVIEGGSASYDLVLDSQPTAPVTITPTLEMIYNDISALSMSVDSLVFTPDNWDIPRTVTVHAAEDDDNALDEGAGITYTVSGGDYEVFPLPGYVIAVQRVTTTDNDASYITVTPSTTTIVEGGATSTLTFTLNNPPEVGDVAISPTHASNPETAGDYSLSAEFVVLEQRPILPEL